MPTRDRRFFVSRAIEYFLRQGHLSRELVIVDDGKDLVEDLIPKVAAIRYLRLDKPITLGAKRNLACEAAEGEIIMHWDDDDWMADWRIGYQITSLLESGADVCGLANVVFYEPAIDGAWCYEYPYRNSQLLAGGTLCYMKRFWQNNRFEQIDMGEDTRFVWSRRPKRLVALDDSAFYIAITHAGNTNPRRTKGKRWRLCSSKEVRDLMGKDLTFYTQMASSKGMETTQASS